MVDWKRIDILVTTPSQLEVIMKIKRKREPLGINPKWFVVDEMDLLLVDKSFSKSVMNIMAYFLGQYKSPFGEENSKRKLVLTGASLKNRINKIPVQEMLEDWFGEMAFVESKDYMKISDKIEHEKLDVSSLDHEDRLHLLKEVIDDSSAEKIVIFCEDKTLVEEIGGYLLDKGINSSVFHSALRPEVRIKSLNEFETRKSIAFVTTDLACRGIDFTDVGLVIQFNFSKNATSLIHRFGRTGRLGKKGKVTSFVDIDDHLLYELFDEYLSKG